MAALLTLLLALLLATLPPPSAALENGLGATPPLGWSGFNFFGFSLNETIMLDTADALVSTGLSALGFQYINLDAGWLTSERDPTTKKVIPVKSKWPNGIRAMSDAIHAKGLLFGVYSDLSDHTCGWGPGSANHYDVDAETFAHDFQADYLKVDFCGAWNGSAAGRTLPESCGAGALGAGGDLRQANTTVANATAWCLANEECGGFTTEGAHAVACDATNTTIRKVYFKDQTTRSNGNPAWAQWQKPGIGRVDFHATPQYAAWKAFGDALNKTGRPIYYSICPHTMASHRGTARNYSGTFPQTPPIYAPPISWTAEQRHGLANSLLVEYQNTVDAWYVPGVDKDGHGDWGILTNIDSMVEATQLNYSTKGSWNDADMMMVCAFGKGQVPGGGMTLSEYRVHYSAWSILASPLIHGCDLRTVQDEHPDCFELIMNPEIVKVSQSPSPRHSVCWLLASIDTSGTAVSQCTHTRRCSFAPTQGAARLTGESGSCSAAS